MAIEALLADGKEKFDHLPCHDLESILYVIFFICTFTKGPNLPRPDFETPGTLHMKSWFSTDPLNSIGFRKVADLCLPTQTVIPGFTEYWNDFAPFALDLINLCFSSTPAAHNKLTHKSMITILEKACATVKEPPASSNMKNLKRNKSTAGGPSESVPLATKRMKRKLEKV